MPAWVSANARHQCTGGAAPQHMTPKATRMHPYPPLLQPTHQLPQFFLSVSLLVQVPALQTSGRPLGHTQAPPEQMLPAGKSREMGGGPR